MITLWGRNNSTNVKKVRWVLAELDLPAYQQILAGWSMASIDQEYLAMNEHRPGATTQRRCQWAGAGNPTPLFVILPRSTGKNRLWWSRLCSARAG